MLKFVLSVGKKGRKRKMELEYLDDVQEADLMSRIHTLKYAAMAKVYGTITESDLNEAENNLVSFVDILMSTSPDSHV